MKTSLPAFRPSSLFDIWWWQEAVTWFGDNATAHLKRWWWAWALAVAGLMVFGHYCTLAINGWTSSLPQKAFIVLKQDKAIERDGYVSFTWAGGGPYPKGLGFVKIVKGIPGDVVTVQGRDFYVNGLKVATAKEHSLKGQPLELGPTGIIPPGHYFVWTPHKDSLDSRYRLTGWVKQEQITGRAVPLI